LLGDGKGEFAAQLGNENSEVFQQLVTFDKLAFAFEVEARDTKAHKLERIFLVLVDDSYELLGRIELFSPFLLRRKSKLH